MDGIKSLFKSRKFLLAMVALAQTLIFFFLDFPVEVWAAIDAVLVVLINAIAKEDAALKSAGIMPDGSYS